MSEALQPVSGQGILDKLEADLNLEDAGRVDALRVAVRAFLEANNVQAARQAEWERVAFTFYPTGDSTRGRWFGPMFEGRDDKGQPVAWPTRNDLDAPALPHIRTRALSSGNPQIQARFCDLLWEFEDRPDPDMARRAVIAYLAVARQHLAQNVQDHALDIARHLRRARIITGQLKDEPSKAEVMAAHREAFDAILRGMSLPIVPCTDILRSMMEQDGALTDQEVNDRLGALDLWADQHPSDANIFLRQRILDVRIEWAQHQDDHTAAHQHRLEIARLHEREGDEVLTRSPSMAQTFFMRAYRLFTSLGATVDTARVKKKLQEVSPKTLAEMKRVSTQVTIPREIVEEIANILRQYPVQDALRLIAGSRWWIPSAAGVRRWLEHAKKAYPLSFLLPKVILDQDGNAYELNQEERDRHDILNRIANDLMMSTRLSMREAFKVLVDELKVTTDDFLAIVGDAPWLDTGRLPILREAFDDYLAGRHISAAHILIPQFEGALRDLAASAGLTPIAIREGRMVPQSMDVLLKNQRLRDGLGEDYVLTVEAFLIDEVGYRVRHVVTHGNVVNAGYFGTEMTEILIYLLLQLTNYRLRRAGSEDDSKGQKDATE